MIQVKPVVEHHARGIQTTAGSHQQNQFQGRVPSAVGQQISHEDIGDRRGPGGNSQQLQPGVQAAFRRVRCCLDRDVFHGVDANAAAVIPLAVARCHRRITRKKNARDVEPTSREPPWENAFTFFRDFESQKVVSDRSAE